MSVESVVGKKRSIEDAEIDEFLSTAKTQATDQNAKHSTAAIVQSVVSKAPVRKIVEKIIDPEPEIDLSIGPSIGPGPVALPLAPLTTDYLINGGGAALPTGYVRPTNLSPSAPKIFTTPISSQFSSSSHVHPSLASDLFLAQTAPPEKSTSKTFVLKVGDEIWEDPTMPKWGEEGNTSFILFRADPSISVHSDLLQRFQDLLWRSRK